MRKLYTGLYCLLMLLFGAAMQSHGQSVTIIKGVLDGSQGKLIPYDTINVKDAVYFDKNIQPKLDTPYSVKNIVTLGINEYSTLYLPPEFTASVDVRIIYTKPNFQVDSITQTLSLNYKANAPYTSRNSFVFNNAHNVTVRILSVTTNATKNIVPALLLENEMQVHPVYKIACTDAVTNVSGSLTVAGDELNVSWDDVMGADDYDLEWTHIDSTALYRYGTPLDTEAVFANNATRVTITRNSYNIPLIYDAPGYIFYRVRSVQERENNVRMETRWSSHYSTGLGKFYYVGHEPTLNWQSNISFAEEGKRKVVVQYYDGSLRGRQTVTKDNSTNTALVAETMYDYQGRPAIQLMPAPTLSNAVQYFHALNIAADGTEYDKNRYDTLITPADYLTGGAEQMSSASGANQYYSSNNPLKDEGINRYLPDAGGYAFMQTEFTPDNTGRISRQSGVGPAFRLGGNHETKYQYGSAGQDELDILFGTDVGDKSHYFKNSVTDANGQVSVTYVDMHGRTIASALAGGADSASLSALPGITALTYTDTLSGRNRNVVKDLTIESVQSQLVPINSTTRYVFTYTLNTPSASVPGCVNGVLTWNTYNVLYDLEVTITDDANNQRLGGAPFVKVFHNYTSGTTPIMNTTPQQINDTFSILLTKGNYTITKRLTVNPEALAYYRDSLYLKNNLCRNLEDFINEQRTIQGATECVPACQACFTSIGTWEAFRVRYMNMGGYSSSDTASYRNEAYAAYQDAIAACNTLCDSVSQATDVLTQLLLDVSPPSGQYANLDDSLGVYSIFYAPDETHPAPYQQDAIVYLDENGNRDTVFDEQTGSWVIPQELSPEQFVGKFKPSWANALLKFHPEYCKYLTYLQYKASYDWDDLARKIDDYKTAFDGGYLNPIGLPVSTYPFTIQTSHSDPIVLKTDEKNDLTGQVQNYMGKGYNMYTLAAIRVKCTDSASSCYTTYNTAANAFSTTLNCTADLDMMWRTWREMYINAKHNIIDEKINAASCSGLKTIASSVLIDAGYVPIFNTSTSSLGSSAPSYVSGSSVSAVNKAGDSVKVAMDSSYAQNCRAYITAWVSQLAPCNYPKSDLDNVIIPALIEVCKKGADDTHPFGSSTIAPGKSNTYNSFQAVLNAYNSTHNITNPWECNAYAITAPAAYDKQPGYYDITLYSKPDSCQCTKLNALHSEYAVNRTDSTFAAYLARTRGISMSEDDLNILLSSCNVSSSCISLLNPVKIPPALQCNTGDICVTCTVVDSLYNKYMRVYGSYAPTKEEGDTLQQKYNRFFANYMNYYLGFSKEAWEYLSFMDECENSGGGGVISRVANTDVGINLVSYTCSNLTTIKNNFLALHPASQGTMLTVTKNIPCTGVTHIYSNMGARTSEYSLAAATGTNGGNWYILRDVPKFNFNIIAKDATFGQSFLHLFGKEQQIEVFTGDARYAHRNQSGDTMIGYFDRLLAPVTVGTTTWANQPGFDTTYRIAFGVPQGFSNSDYTPYFTPMMRDLFNAYLYNRDYGMLFHLNREDTGGAKYRDIIFWNNSDTSIAEPPYISVTYTASRCEEFAAYVNEQLGSSLTSAQVNNLYRNTCGTYPGICDTTGYPSFSGPLLCGKSKAVFGTVTDSVNNCSDTAFFAYSVGYERYNAYRDSLKNAFDKAYRDTAIAGGLREFFTMAYATSEYHYTLYYYDQAGNLVRTVPPAGVYINRSLTFRANLAKARAAGTVLVPPHTMATEYRYNTLNQVISQKTPDGGITNFWYDRLGRQVISQNAKQALVNAYNYTQYDALGRIVEVGEITSSIPITSEISRNDQQLSGWITQASSSRSQITHTTYDTAYMPISGLYLSQANLRNRVSWSGYFNRASALDSMNFESASFYSYDIHGNVDTLLQDYKQGAMARFNNRFKKIVYKYDLISGNVNFVAYQPGQKDAFYHRYIYDSENRITNVETSSDSIYWENDAYYQYYKHGPLARTVFGQQQVQGSDYAYTLQGWLKGINSTALTPVYDMGGDGSTGSLVAKDVYGFGIHYYGRRDYAPINPSMTPFAVGAIIKPLFNGNIAAISENIPSVGTPLEFTYSYDVLNRLVGMDAYQGLDSLSNAWTKSFKHIDDFQEAITYDGNGNIQKYKRNGNFSFAGGPLAMDSLTYNYRPGTNKLSYISDSVRSDNYGNDIDGQSVGNFQYDSIGNITADIKSGIDSIKWTVAGKVAKIYKHNGTAILYKYDAAGNRINKTVDSMQTWYVRDAAGNVLSVYTYGDSTVNNGQLSQTEVDLYGTNRLGITTQTTNVQEATVPVLVNIPGIGSGKNINFIRGKKAFELSNHLGNVLATVSDKKTPVSLDNNTVDHYEAVITSAQDYYPFGMLMPGRGGHMVSGGYASGSSVIDGYNVPKTLDLSYRENNQPAEYAATDVISFNEGFASDANDKFIATITGADYTSAGSTG